MIFSEAITIRLDTVKELVWNLPEKKKIARTVKHSTNVDIWACFSCQSFDRIVCFKRNLNAEFMCGTYKRGTVRKQFGLDSTTWEPQGDNDGKHTRKAVLNRKASHRIQKLDWPSMSPDLTPIENVWQFLKMKVRKKEFDKLSMFDLRNKERIKVFGNGHAYYTCT